THALYAPLEATMHEDGDGVAQTVQRSPDPRSDAAEVLLAGERAVAVVDLMSAGPVLRWANPAFERVTGHTLDSAHTHEGLISPGYRGVVLAEIAEHARDGEDFSLSIPLVRADGHEVILDTVVSPRTID